MTNEGSFSLRINRAHSFRRNRNLLRSHERSPLGGILRGTPSGGRAPA